jgi:preprotein translocase subunit SecE
MGPQGSRTGVMTKENSGSSSGWAQILQEFLKADIYKRSQGRLVRQFTCLAIWVAFALAAWRAYPTLTIDMQASRWVAATVSAILLLAGLWIGYRIVNLPSFADFLIAVEAEMNKVSWPARVELVRASMVVILLMFGLTTVLFTYDLLLTKFFQMIGVVP